MKTSTKLLIELPFIAAIIAGSEANAQEVSKMFNFKLKENVVSTKSTLWENSASNVIFPYGGVESHVQLDVGGMRQIAIPSPANGFMNLGFEGNWAIISKLGSKTRLITSIGADATLKFASENDVKRVLGNGSINAGAMFTFSNDIYRLFAGVKIPFSTLKDTTSAVLPQNTAAFVGTKLGPVFLTFDGEFSNKGLQRFGGLIEIVPVYFISFTGTVKTGVKDAYRLALADVGAKIKVTKSNKYFIDLHVYGGLERSQFYQSGRFADKYLYGGSAGFESTGNYRISLGIDGGYEPLNTELNKNGIPNIGGFMKFQLYFRSLGEKKKYKRYSSLYIDEVTKDRSIIGLVQQVPSGNDIKSKMDELTKQVSKIDLASKSNTLYTKTKSGLFVPPTAIKGTA